ncbi:TolC family protein [Desulfurispirillum indicum]|uniref:TolC family protein n=1 Tax=Desulfurispirillum indicum TaxID=936456 RepID=UPI001CFBEFAA|nr:TolC family protein [Desulfurispirillum indicum]UCZ56590.1 TolC family protein [Desulfurispirillum indicum]
MTPRPLIIALCGLLLATPLTGTAAQELSLEEAVLMSLRSNRELRMQQLQPQLRQTFEEVEQSLFDARLFAEAGYGAEQGQTLSPGVAGLVESDTSQWYLQGGLRQEFATGTTFEAILSHNQRDIDNPDNLHQWRAGIGINQALLQGRGSQVNLVRVEQARLDTDISRNELRGYTQALVANVESLYWEYALASRQVEIYEQSLEVARVQLRQTTDRVEVGAMARTELAAAKAEVARRQQELIDARSRMRVLATDLTRLMGLEHTAEPPLPQQPTLPAVYLDTLEEHITFGLQQRPEIREARLRQQRGELEVTRTRNGLLPRLDLFVTLGKSGYADSFGSALDEMGGDDYDATIGLRLSYPLENRSSSAQHRAATISQHQVDLSLENLNQLVAADVRKAYLEVDRSREQIEASAATLELQEEVLRAEMEKFEAGTSTALLVAQAQRDLLAARIQQARSIADYRRALVELYRLDGSLLQRRGIELET